MALDEKPIDDLELERGLTPEPEQQETTEEKIKEGQRSGAGIGSFFSLLALAPLGIYSYLNSPDRYSARKLEKEAQKYARNKVKEIVKSAQKIKTYTAEEKKAFEQMSLDGYYDGYVRDHPKRADLLAKKSTNQQLLNAIERRNKEDEENEAESQSGQPASASTTAPTSAPAPIAPVGEGNIRSLSTTDVASPMGMSNNEPPTRSPGISMPSAPSLPGSNTPSGVKPSVPGAPGKTPSIPGKRGLPHIPKPGLPGLPNPTQALARLIFNPANFAGGLVIGLILVVFIFILMIGGPGVGLNSSPVSVETPICTGNEVIPMPVADVPSYIHIMTNESPQHKTYVYKGFSIALGSKTYASLLKGKPIQIYFYPPQAHNVIGGGASYGDGKRMSFTGFFEANYGTNTDDWKYHILIHESIHIIQQRHGNMGFNLANFSSSGSDGNSCYDNGWLRSYPFRSDNYPNATDYAHKLRESMAEAGANNVFCKPGTLCDMHHIYHSQAIDYQKSCKNTYEWTKQNIFGGDDFFAKNPATCTPGAGGGGATTNMCGGFYAGPASVKYTDAWNSTVINNKAGRNIYMQKGINFGDPQCDLVNARSDPKIREKEYLYLQQIDPKNAKYWWDVIIPCESAHSYSPFAYNPNSYSKLGAYGLLQMNPSINPYTGKSRGTTTDIGDVVWRQQLQNGVNRSKNMTYFRQYWECASNGVKVIK